MGTLGDAGMRGRLSGQAQSVTGEPVACQPRRHWCLAHREWVGRWPGADTPGHH